MKTLLTSVLIIISLSAFSQFLTLEVVGGAGDSFKTDNVYLSWTIGECVTETFVGTSSTFMLTQGFHQGEKNGGVSINELYNEGIGFSLYPNPSVDITHIVFALPHNGEVKITVRDICGRKIKEVTENEFDAGTYSLELNVSPLNVGIYLVSFCFDNATSTRKLFVIE